VSSFLDNVKNGPVTRIAQNLGGGGVKKNPLWQHVTLQSNHSNVYLSAKLKVVVFKSDSLADILFLAKTIFLGGNCFVQALCLIKKTFSFSF
jgi:hypothetical protein